MEEFFKLECGKWEMKWDQESAVRLFSHKIPALIIVPPKESYQEIEDPIPLIISRLKLRGKMLTIYLQNDSFSHEFLENI